MMQEESASPTAAASGSEPAQVQVEVQSSSGKPSHKRTGSGTRPLQALVAGAAAVAVHLEASLVRQQSRESVYDPGDEEAAVEAVEVRVSQAAPSEGEAATTSTTRPLSSRMAMGPLRTKGMVRPKNYVRVGKKTGVPVVGRADGVTAEWLTLAFRSRGLLEPDGAVEAIRAKPIGEGQGEYGDLLAVEVLEARGATAGLPRFMICKMAPAKAPLPPIVVKGIYTNEAHFYNDFTVEGGGLPRPECYHVSADLGSKAPKFCLVIENAVTGAHGGPSASHQYLRSEGCDDLPRLFMVMRALAQFHATWWGCDGRSKKSPLHPFLHPVRTGFGLLRNAVPLVSKNAFKCLPGLMADATYADGSPVPKFGAEYAPILGWAKRLHGRYRWLTRELLPPGRMTLCHNDAHLENIFFHGRFPGGCAFIDFGNIFFGHGLNDVAFFLSTCLEPDARRAMEAELVRAYHEKLVEHGVQGYSLLECTRDYKLQLWRSVIQMAAAVPDFANHRKKRTGMFAQHPTKADRALYDMYAAYNRRLAAALIDHDWISLLDGVGASCCNYFCCKCT